MPIPIPIIIGGAAIAGIAAWLFSKKSGGDDGNDGEEEQGTLEERLRRRCKEHSKKNCFFFDRYVPFGKYHTDYSADILKLKEMDADVIEKFSKKFRFLKGLDNLVIIRVPSHEAGKENGVEQLTELISQKYGISDLSSNFIRITDVLERKKAKKGERYMTDIQKEEVKISLEITDSEKIDGKDILLIDDIATTWDTIDCCASVIARDARPGEIYSLVLGRTNTPKKS